MEEGPGFTTHQPPATSHNLLAWRALVSATVDSWLLCPARQTAALCCLQAEVGGRLQNGQLEASYERSSDTAQVPMDLAVSAIGVMYATGTVSEVTKFGDRDLRCFL